jgi:hypothetical protein
VLLFSIFINSRLERKIRTKAGVLSSLPHFFLSPLNLLKTRLQASSGLKLFGMAKSGNQEPTLRRFVQMIAQREGVKAFWNGTVVSSASVLMIGLFFFLQNTFRNRLYPFFHSSGRLIQFKTSILEPSF